jgi:PAS domain S-box-containing protein
MSSEIPFENSTNEQASDTATDNLSRLFQALIENAPDGVVLINAESKFTYASPAATRLYGYDLTKDPLATPDGITHPDDLAMVLSELGKIIADPTYIPIIQYRVKNYTGQWFWIESTFTNLLAAPDVESIVINFRDITDQKLAEEKLSKSEDMYRSILNASPDDITVTNLEGTITLVSSSAYKIFGYEREDQLLGRSLFDLVAPEDHERARANIQLMFQENDVQEGEYSILCGDGSYLLCEVKADRICDSLGQPYGMIFMIRDTTERKMAENRLNESESKYYNLYKLMRMMSDTMPDLLWAKDVNNRFIFTNKAVCEKLLGAVDTDEPIGKDDMFFAKRQREQQPDILDWFTFGELCIDSDEITKKEMKYMQFDEFGNVNGEFLFLDVHKAPLFNENNEFIGLVGSARDITERMKVERLLNDIIEKNPISIQIVDKNGFTLRTNQANTDIFGAAPPPDFSIFDDLQSKSPELEQLIRKVKNGEVVHLPDLPFNAHDIYPDLPDVPVWIKALIFPLKDTTGKPEKFVLLHENITERKNAGKTINILAHAIKSISECVSITDMNDNILFVNEDFLRTYKYEEHELLGKPISIIRSMKAPLSFAEKILPETLTGQWQGEVINTTKDGDEFPVFLSTSVIHNDQGKPIALIGVATDITERKLAEKELRNKMNEMERFHRLTIGREIKMIELKKEINALLLQLGKEEKYNIVE